MPVAWYLGLLIRRFPPSGWPDICTVNRIVHDTDEPGAQQLGTVQNMEDYTIGFQEAVDFSAPRKLRTLLLIVTRITFGTLVRDMQDAHSDALVSDFLPVMLPSSARDEAVRHIDIMLDKHGKTTTSVSLPPGHHPMMEYHRLLAPFDHGKLRIETDYITA